MFGSKNTTHATETRIKVGTLIGEGAIFNGDLSAPEAVRVDGTVNGNFTCEKELIVGPSGQIKGNISAQNVVISGTVDGDVSVSGKLEILSTGKLTGNISAKSLVVDEDACFDGRCTMTTSGQVISPVSSTETHEESKTQPPVSAPASDQNTTTYNHEKRYLSQPKEPAKSYGAQTAPKETARPLGGQTYAKDMTKPSINTNKTP